MSRVDATAPRALLDQYRRLAPEQRAEFIQLVASESNDELFGAFWNALPIQERSPFMLQVVSFVRPILIREAIPIVRAFPELSVEELVGKVSVAYEESVTELEAALILREERKFKAQRDPKSRPKTIRRNIEICDCHQQNPQLSKAQLGKRFKVSAAYVRKVLRNQPHWRRLAGNLPE